MRSPQRLNCVGKSADPQYKPECLQPLQHQVADCATVVVEPPIQSVMLDQHQHAWGGAAESDVTTLWTNVSTNKKPASRANRTGTSKERLAREFVSSSTIPRSLRVQKHLRHIQMRPWDAALLEIVIQYTRSWFAIFSAAGRKRVAKKQRYVDLDLVKDSFGCLWSVLERTPQWRCSRCLDIDIVHLGTDALSTLVPEAGAHSRSWAHFLKRISRISDWLQPALQRLAMCAAIHARQVATAARCHRSWWRTSWSAFSHM